jgi:hypothetical protein
MSWQGLVKPRQSIPPARAAKPPQACDKRPKAASKGGDTADPDGFDRKVVLNPEGENRQYRDQKAPQRPERAGQPFAPQPCPCQAKGPDEFSGHGAAGLVPDHALCLVAAFTAMGEEYRAQGFRQTLVAP